MSDREPVPGHVRSEPLYALGEALSAVMAEIEAELERNGGEYTPEMEAKLAAVDIPWREKVERVGLRWREQMAKAGAAGLEETRLAKRRKALERECDWLLTYLRGEMERQGVGRVEGALVTVRIQENPPAASALVPLEFLDPDWVRRAEPKLTLDREAILAAHREGKTLPPEIVITRSKSVRVA